MEKRTITLTVKDSLNDELDKMADFYSVPKSTVVTQLLWGYLERKKEEKTK